MFIDIPSVGGNPSIVQLLAAVRAAQEVHGPVRLRHGVEHPAPPRRVRAGLSAFVFAGENTDKKMVFINNSKPVTNQVGYVLINLLVLVLVLGWGV